MSKAPVSMMVLGHNGRRDPLTFRMTPAGVVQAWFDDACVATVRRIDLLEWLGSSGTRRPLVDIPLTLRWTDLGAWLEIHGHVEPTLVESIHIRRLLELCRRPHSAGPVA